jgi:two-component system chemotaxis sensor kinase CheA
MDELIGDFIVEATESIEQVDAELVRFEANPGDKDALNAIFRLVHTVKGACGFLGLSRLERVAHAGETLLGRYRDGELEVTSQSVTAVLCAVDRIKEILAGLATAGVEPEGEDEDVLKALHDLADGKGATVAAPPSDPEPEAAAEAIDPELGRPRLPGEVSLADLDAAFAAAEAPCDAVEPAAAPAEPPPAPRAETPAPAARADERRPIDQVQGIRVGVDVLEDMMTLVSELVLTRNQLLQINRQHGDGLFLTPLQRLSAITGELQDSVMKTRMQPIGEAWKKLPRLVRDLSQDLGKKIELVLEGEGTELDRQVLEVIKDPLTHLIRNSADHGLESGEDRKAAGKPEAGVIRLTAFHEGGSIVILLEDDGRGLDTEKIRAKAVERGLVTPAESEQLTEAQVQRLIFAPGFSTAATVTNVSGRGVGMDVVRTNIESIGGQIELKSQAGLGTSFSIKIPLTLAILPALVVKADGQRYALPQASVLELAQVGGASGHKLESIEGVTLLRLRDRLLPMLPLCRVLQADQREPREGFVVVMQVGRKCFGVLVEDVLDTEEIVVKPLAAALREVSLFSGATILGDGSVVLICDPNSLAGLAGEAPAGAATTMQEIAARDRAGERASLLIVRAGEGAPKVAPLSRVTRLERIAADRLEPVDGRYALQYRGRLMPVIPLAGAAIRTSGMQPILVLQGEGYAMGLAVDEIVDMVEDHLEVELSAAAQGVCGAAVVAGQAAELVDIDHYLVRGLAEHVRTEADPSAKLGAAA